MLQNIQEEWKPVVGFKGKYEASSHGRVRGVTGKILKHRMDRKGYPCVSISTDRGPRLKRVHSLVAAAFIGPRPPGLQVNHIDGRKANNEPSNLEYVTNRENALHAIRMGLWTRVAQRRLSDEQVMAIRDLRGVVSTTAIAKMFGIHNSYVSRVQRGLRRSDSFSKNSTS